MTRSNTEAEYRDLADTTSELLWLQWLLKDLGVSIFSAILLYCDNQSVIRIAYNDVFDERTKHIKIDYHFIRYHLVHGALKLFSVSSKDQLADIFIKGAFVLGGNDFRKSFFPKPACLAATENFIFRKFTSC